MTQIVDIETGTIVGTIDETVYEIALDETGQYALASVNYGNNLKFFKLSNADTETLYKLVIFFMQFIFVILH